MKNLQEFMKNLNILFVEDEQAAREKLGKFLNRKFENVTLKENGLEGFLAFQQQQSLGKNFDLIISDINMPKMDGLEMLEQIRAIDKDMPFIFITARSEAEKIIKAISFHVNDYILKPLDLEIIDQKTDAICEDIYYKQMYENQKIEMQNYMNIINQEAIVSKTDLKGKITFVNDAFCEVSGYTKEELIGKSHNIIRHHDVSKRVFEDMWKTIQDGNIWEGTFKNRAKNGEAYFLKSKIIPIFDSHRKNIIEYMGIRFLVTDDENKKRSTQRKIIEEISKYKKIINEKDSENENLLKKINELSNSIFNLEEKNSEFLEKKKLLLRQIEAYESNKLQLNKVELMEKQDKYKQFESMRTALMVAKNHSRALEKKMKDMQDQYISKIEELDSFIQKDMENKKRIMDLKDLVSNLQKEVTELKTPKGIFS